ncbi:hypothetical protein [Rhodococcus jostii]|uniref:hypothetical protein n=1 Tax=Rhodococcus jostii TaxID=132919 RepID=UPI0005A2C23F|nr:hypothetical protein [Rhodococcus jostii]
MDNGSVLQAHDLRPPWGLTAAAAGCVAVVLTSRCRCWSSPPYSPVWRSRRSIAHVVARCRPLAARCASIRAGLCVPAIPLSVLVLVDSL